MRYGTGLHGSATMTEATVERYNIVREPRAVAKRHGVNPKTIAKWKARKSVSDLRTGPKEPRSTVLSAEEEAVVVAFRRHALLPLDDCLYALQPTLPHLTRSSLHRRLQRHGISRLPQVEGEASAKRKFKAYPIGYFISTSPRFELRKASSPSSSPSTERRSSPSSRCTRRWRAAPQGISCAA